MEMTITRTCPMCKKETIIEVDPEAYDGWKKGKLIQLAFPQLSADEREMIQTGIDPDCWNSLFPPEEDEEEVEGETIDHEQAVKFIYETDWDVLTMTFPPSPED
jgi:hypothetical protein